MLGNCFSWAFPKWLKQYFNGSALVIRKSAHTWAPHFALTKCIKTLEVEEFIPEVYVTHKFFVKYFPIHTFLFKGLVRNGPAKCICENCQNKKEING